MKDWIEILIGVVVFGVLIFVHVIDHVIAFKKMLDKRKADAEAAAANPVDVDPIAATPPIPPPTIPPPTIRESPPREAPLRELPPLPPPLLAPLPSLYATPKPPRDPRRRKTQTTADAQIRPEILIVSAPIVTQRSSAVLPVVQEMLKDRKNLASGFVLQEIFGPPKSKRS